MTSGDDFARELFEDAKCSLKMALSELDANLKQRHLRHSLMSAFSFLELQIELIARHFKDNTFFSLHERGIINQREIVFDKGVFKMKSTQRFSRLGERMLLFQHKFKAENLAERQWWSPLIAATEKRNSIAHPREAITLDAEETGESLQSVLDCANDLFKIVFQKGLPYAALGLKPKL